MINPHLPNPLPPCEDDDLNTAVVMLCQLRAQERKQDITDLLAVLPSSAFEREQSYMYRGAQIYIPCFLAALRAYLVDGYAGPPEESLQKTK